MPTFESIRRTLSSLQAALRARLVREGALLGLATMGLVGSTSILLAHAGLSPNRALYLSLVWIPAGLIGWFKFRKKDLAPLQSILEAARFSQVLTPSLGTGPSSAVELADEMASNTDGPPFSEALARAHVEQTARHLHEAKLEEKIPDHLGPLHRHAAKICAGALVLMSLCAAKLDAGSTRMALFLSGDTTLEISELPLVGDMRLTFNYPSYTGLSPRIIEGSDGRIETLKATQVVFEATADEPLESAALVLINLTGQPIRTVPMSLETDNKVKAQFSVMENGRYYVTLQTTSGDKKRGRREHPIVIQQDAHPTISMDTPATDIELKQTQSAKIIWRARDDFAVDEVSLVIESNSETGTIQTKRIALATADQKAKAREGSYSYRPTEDALDSQDGVVIYLEAVDNDVVTGPKRTTSTRRRINIFSARRNHARIQAQLQGALDKLVDLLSEELISFSAATNIAGQNLKTLIATQSTGLGLLESVYRGLKALTAELKEDTLSAPDTIAAFQNTAERVAQALTSRENAVKRQAHVSNERSAVNLVAATQTRFIPKLEKDIAYLDDLLALGRIQDLKQTAADLLSSQKELQGLLEAFRDTQDPALKKELETRIQNLRREMMQLLKRMSEIKKSLPGEYRNMESASMLKVDDQLGRLEEMLANGDLEGAAQELEQLANMIEQMVESIDDAGESYGGEKYDELRESMDKFAQEFEALEQQQKALKTRTDELFTE